MGKTNYKKKPNGELDGSYPSPVSPLPTPNLPKNPTQTPPSTSDTHQPLNTVTKAFHSLLLKSPHIQYEDLPKEIRETLDYLEIDMNVIEFENNSSNHDADWVTIADMSDHKKAGNNCFAATSAISIHLVERVGLPEHWTNYEIELYYTGSGKQSGDGVHWANILKNEQTGEEWIMDYTARQFDENAPFPLIARRQEWRHWISSIIRNRYGGELQDEKTY